MKLKKRISEIAWWQWIVGIDLFLILMTVIYVHLPQFPKKWALLHHFLLTTEMNLGAWWSGSLLLMLGLLAYEQFSVREGENQTRIAWLMLSLIFIGLSLDEIGSFHERVGEYGGWRALLPFGVVGILVFLLTFIMLFKHKVTRKVALMILLGLSLLSSAALYEYLEHKFNWPIWLRGIRAGAEEGTELLGMFICLWSLVEQRKRSGWPNLLSPVIPNPAQMKYLYILLIVGIVIHLAVSWLAVHYIDIHDGRGNPAVWYPSAALIIPFCAFLWHAWTNEEGRLRSMYMIAILFLFSSILMLYMYMVQAYAELADALGPFSNFYGFLAALLILYTVIFFAAYRRISVRVASILGFLIIFILAGYLLNMPIGQYIAAGVFTLSITTIFLMPETGSNSSAHPADEAEG